jgi:hypothetical protein
LPDVYLRVFRDPNRTLVAICDSALIGKTFREGKVKLDVKAEFYRGSLTSVEKAMEALESADIGNLVGDVSVSAAIDRGLVDSAAIIKVNGIPHVQIVKM